MLECMALGFLDVKLGNGEEKFVVKSQELQAIEQICGAENDGY
jgi:hypothetical protein